MQQPESVDLRECRFTQQGPDPAQHKYQLCIVWAALKCEQYTTADEPKQMESIVIDVLEVPESWYMLSLKVPESQYLNKALGSTRPFQKFPHFMASALLGTNETVRADP